LAVALVSVVEVDACGASSVELQRNENQGVGKDMVLMEQQNEVH
jgi:hypothetical protein